GLARVPSGDQQPGCVAVYAPLPSELVPVQLSGFESAACGDWVFAEDVGRLAGGYPLGHDATASSRGGPFFSPSLSFRSGGPLGPFGCLGGSDGSPSGVRFPPVSAPLGRVSASSSLLMTR